MGHHTDGATVREICCLRLDNNNNNWRSFEKLGWGVFSNGMIVSWLDDGKLVI